MNLPIGIIVFDWWEPIWLCDKCCWMGWASMTESPFNVMPFTTRLALLAKKKETIFKSTVLHVSDH